MYKVGDIVVYGSDGLCRVEEIARCNFGGVRGDYYMLRQINRENSVTYVPVGNQKSTEKMRPVLKKSEIEELVRALPAEESPWIENDRDRQKAFKDVLLYGDSKDLFRMTRTLYLHKRKQEQRNKKMHVADEYFLKDAEKMLFEEIAFVMEIPCDRVLEYITQNAPE